MASYISFDGASNKYPSRRSVVYGKNGMVCTSQALAAQAGLDVLKEEATLLMRQSRQQSALPFWNRRAMV